MRTRFLLVAPALLFLFVASARAAGPVWTVREVDTFQDNFASDGTTTGTVRADMAADILPPSSPGIQPGDSSVVTVSDPAFGLADDLVFGGKAVYCYVAVYPLGQPTKTGAGISGGARWPYAGTEIVNGISWTKLRFDQSDLGGGPVPDNFCIDLNDNLFTPCDTNFFFYGAKSDDGPGSMSYFSLEFGSATDITIAAALPMEFTCLPANVLKFGGGLLYIDGADGTASQIYWEYAFEALVAGRFTDRYDVRGPAEGANNGPASRVVDVQYQVNAWYGPLYWDTGGYNATLGDGTLGSHKSDDWGLINSYLGNLVTLGGVLLFGDDIAEDLNSSSSPSSQIFKQLYMPFVLVSGDHTPLFGVAPTARHWPGRCFTDDFLLHGGGETPHDFDVVQPTGASLLEITYVTLGPPSGTNGAVISHINGRARVLMHCFGLESVRDDDSNGIMDRAKLLKDGGFWTGAGPHLLTGIHSTSLGSLSQNVPNPFNPVTTIAFSLSSREHARLAIYDVNGALVHAVVDETRDAGGHAATWDGRDESGERVASGVYFYRLTTPTFSQTRKMVLLK